MTYFLAEKVKNFSKTGVFVLALMSGVAGGSFECRASDFPEQSTNSGLEGKSEVKNQKEPWITFKPFYSDPERRIRFPIPGGSMSLPVVKGSIWGTLGAGCCALLPYPLNYGLGFPLMGFGFGTSYYPLGKPFYHRAIFGGSVLVATAAATVVSLFLGALNEYDKENRSPSHRD